MDSALMSLLGAFLLSLIGLFVFIWSLRKGLLIENPRAASVIFAPGEIGHADDPALAGDARQPLRQAVAQAGESGHPPDPDALQHRVEADRSSAFPVFMFVAFA